MDLLSALLKSLANIRGAQSHLFMVLLKLSDPILRLSSPKLLVEWPTYSVSSICPGTTCCDQPRPEGPNGGDVDDVNDINYGNKLTYYDLLVPGVSNSGVIDIEALIVGSDCEQREQSPEARCVSGTQTLGFDNYIQTYT